jgi:hypothetical protein
MDKRYQIFVSSTYSDLQDERRAIIQTLLEMDCIPAGMELFPAADEEQFEFITRVIDDCDYYLLIIGGRYGSTDASGISYTEKEYDYARSRGMQVLSFIHEKPENIAFGKSEVDQINRQKLAEFREKAKVGKLVKFWSDPRDLPRLVMTSLTRTIKLHPAVGWVRADQVANVEVLSELNELRKRNEALAVELAKVSPSEQIENLAGLDDFVKVSGLWAPQGTGSHSPFASPASFSVAWGKIFAEIGPKIMSEPGDATMRGYFLADLAALYLVRRKKADGTFHVSESMFDTAKLQFIALGLVRVEMRATQAGAMAPFWFLTPLGRATLLKLRTIKIGQPDGDQREDGRSLEPQPQ